MAWYTHWFGTRYYTLLYGHRDQQDARPWADAIARRLGLRSGQRLLDMGCGRGRHARCFTELGLEVTGIDQSSESIAAARVEVPGVDFRVHDMREALTAASFDVVVCLFTSLGYSADRMDDLRAVRAAAHVLKPGGHFVLDVLNGCLVRQGLVEQECTCQDGVRFTLTRRVQGDIIVKEIAVDDQGEQHHFTEQVHAWKADEVRQLLSDAGLRLDELTDGPEPVPFDADRSERIVAWAHKPA